MKYCAISKCLLSHHEIFEALQHANKCMHKRAVEMDNIILKVDKIITLEDFEYGFRRFFLILVKRPFWAAKSYEYITTLWIKTCSKYLSNKVYETF